MLQTDKEMLFTAIYYDWIKRQMVMELGRIANEWYCDRLQIEQKPVMRNGGS